MKRIFTKCKKIVSNGGGNKYEQVEWDKKKFRNAISLILLLKLILKRI